MVPIKSFAVITLGSLFVSGGTAWAQSVVGNGANTSVINDGGDYQITGGALSSDNNNLFHSFEQFGLTATESATFITQPNVVNVVGRINGGDPSIIDGQLGLTGSTANLFLLNPVGVIFGADATLALPGDLHVSTADGLAFADNTFDVVGTPDYASLVGNPTGILFRFSNPGSIINEADLSLEEDSALRLTGGNVVSTGTVTAEEIAIAAVPQEQLIRLSPNGSLLSYDIAVADGSSLSPLTLPELLTGAGDRVNSLQLENDGTLRLVSTDLALPATPGTTLVNGIFTASDITLLGNTVGVVESVLDASGPDGGGTIRIGGSYQGQGPLPNAQITYVDANSVINASATDNGNGGEIIVWGDQTTHALGQFLVRGGDSGGNGGLVETSGLQGLTLGSNSPDITAPSGVAGQWLIDPFDVVIDDDFEDQGFDPANPFVAISSPAQLTTSSLATALGGGGTVRVTTGNAGSETGDITLNSDLGFFNTGEATLSLEAAGSILLNGAIFPSTETGSLNINLEADTDNTGNGQVVLGNPDSGETPGEIINTAGGNLTVTANSTALGTPAILLVEDYQINIGDGLLTLTGTTNSENVGIRLTEDIFGSGGISLSSNRDIEVNTLVSDGDITVNTPQFFRASGITVLSEIGPAASVVSRGGQVTITHGGNGETPFTVGEAEVNGTAGSIIATENQLDPPQELFEDFVQGDIAILTGSSEEPDPVEPDPIEDDPVDADDCTADCTTNRSRPEITKEDPETLLTVDPDLVPSSSLDVEAAILRNERDYTEEYRQYLTLGMAEPAKPTLPQLQFELSLVAEETGAPPAIVYVSFVPEGTASGEMAAAKEENRSIQPTDVLELVVVTPEGLPILKTLPIQNEQVLKTADRFRNNVTNRGRVRTRTYISAAQDLHTWLIEPIEAELRSRGITNLAFVMPPGLRSLPVAALHDGESFLVERYSVGLMPSVSLTDMRYVDVRETEVLAMGASNFEDQPELPAVPIELRTIAENLWAGDFVLNETFTPDALVASRARKPYGIVHLATHGEFKSGNIDNSYIQFWDRKLSLDQVRQLGLNDPPVQLMVLSACRTALGSEEAELGFAGFAVQAGVKTAMASLWKVDDVGTAGLMTQFYTSLQTEPVKAEALRQAQLAMINGDIRVDNGQLVWSGGTLPLPQDLAQVDSSLFAHPYFWASFTTIGSPW
ncbi:MAG: CHAT domain-containing protein [Cyanobacteria bacterium P01_D01_bin.156]